MTGGGTYGEEPCDAAAEAGDGERSMLSATREADDASGDDTRPCSARDEDDSSSSRELRWEDAVCSGSNSPSSLEPEGADFFDVAALGCIPVLVLVERLTVAAVELMARVGGV